MNFLSFSLAFLKSLPRHVPGLAGRGGGQGPGDPLDAALVALGPDDALTLRDACEGVQVFGATGSGKTSGSGAALARAFLASGFGGLVMCAKPGEFDLWKGYARETGREPDLVRFAPDEQWRFNPLDYELTRPTRGAGLVGNIVALFLQAMEAGGRGAKHGGDDAFWQDALSELLTNAVHLASLATEHVRLADVLRTILSAAHSRDDVLAENSRWREESECFAMLLAAGKNATTDAARGDYDITEDYFLRTLPELSDKTRSIIVSSFTALASPMLRHPMRELFCAETNLTPAACERGAVIVLDLPLKQFGNVGAFAQVLWKMCFQRSMEQRDTNKSPVPVFLWADESQFFVSSYDQQFLPTARSSRTCTVYLTQNLPSYYDALGKDRAGRDKADALLGNLTTKIWHANGDVATNEHAAKTLGQTWQMLAGSSSGASTSTAQNGHDAVDMVTTVSAQDNRGSTFSSQLAYRVLPQEFTTFRQGGPGNDFEVDALLFKPGRVFRATGTNYIRITFKQR